MCHGLLQGLELGGMVLNTRCWDPASESGKILLGISHVTKIGRGTG